MEIYIGIIVFVVIALVGWAIGEVKYRDDIYVVNDEEKEAAIKEAAHHPKTDHEMGIRDVIKTISTKGYKAV